MDTVTFAVRDADTWQEYGHTATVREAIEMAYAVIRRGDAEDVDVNLGNEWVCRVMDHGYDWHTNELSPPDEDVSNLRKCPECGSKSAYENDRGDLVCWCHEEAGAYADGEVIG